MTVLGIKNCVQVTQGKSDTAQEAGSWESLVRAVLSFSFNQPTNQQTHKQVNSFSQLGLCVFGGRESA